MASFYIDKITNEDIKPVELSSLERDFLNFMLYQYGCEYMETEEQSEWYSELRNKLS